MDFFFLKKKLITSYVKVSLNKKFEIIFKYRIFTVNKFQRSKIFFLYIIKQRQKIKNPNIQTNRSNKDTNYFNQRIFISILKYTINRLLQIIFFQQ